MTAPGFCTCKRDFPQRASFHPPAGAAWHYLCDKPVLAAALGADPSWTREDQAAEDARHAGEQWPPGNGWPRSGLGWPRG